MFEETCDFMLYCVLMVDLGLEFGVLSSEEEAIGVDCDRLAWVSWYEVCYRNYAVFSAKISTELLDNDYLDVFNSPRRHASLFLCFYLAYLG